ncbi:MAG: DUF494 family protein [bacterium]|nr:DUF494 family protein [bacterium]
MQKRLKEFVIYILENSDNLGPEERAQLEEMRERLNLNGFPFAEIEETLQYIMSMGQEGAEAQKARMMLLTDDAREYLARVVLNGLLSSEQEEEVLARAGRLFQDGVELADVQFLIASLIFDENLVNYFGAEFHELDGGFHQEQRRKLMH